METHVHSFGHLFSDGGIDNAGCCRVISLNRCLRLRVTKLGEAGANRFGDLSVVEQGSELCLRGGYHNITECAAFGVEGTIGRRFGRGQGGIRGVITEDEVTSRAAAGVADGEVGCVGIDV